MSSIKIPPQIIGYILGATILLWIVYLLLKRIGLVESRQDKVREQKEEAAKESAVKFFPPTVWKNYPASTAMDSTRANEYAKTIRNSFGWINDDEAAIYSVFQKLAYKQNVSQLAEAYEKLYGKDLHASLFSSLSSNEMQYIYNIIDLKPTK